VPDFVAIVSGAGTLPRLLADKLAKDGTAYVIVAFEGHEPDWLVAHPHVIFPIEKPGKLLKHLKSESVHSVVFAGAMARPNVNPVRLDLLGARLAASLLGGRGKGDDATLREIARVFEAENLRVLAASDIYPALLPKAGIFTLAKPDKTDRADAARAAQLVATIGALDVGQGAVVARGLCLGLEALPGTDRMLAGIARMRIEMPEMVTGGVLFKAAKPTQDRRMDLPAIGVETIRNAHVAGLKGVVIGADDVMVLDLDAVVAEADRLGLFLWCRAAT